MKNILGKVIEVTFYDHSEDAEEPCICTAYGIVVKHNDKFLVLVCWDLPFETDECRKLNNKSFTILLSTIIELKIYEKGRRIKEYSQYIH